MEDTYDIKNKKIVKRYAKALAEFDEDFTYDLKTVLDALEKNKDLADFLNHPIVDINDRKDVLEKIFKDKVSAQVLDLTYVLLDNNRFSLFEAVCMSYKDALDEKNNVMKIDVISAVNLDEEDKEALFKKLQEKTRGKIILNYHTDESILGGLLLKAQDKVIDLSLKKRFENLKA